VPAVQIHPDVAGALDDRHAVVALETAVVTAGLPRTPMDAPQLEVDDAIVTEALTHWRGDSPTNLELALAMQRIVQSHGVTPATVVVTDGALHIGIDVSELVLVANDETAGKCSSADLAAALTQSQTAGTTVSATLAACALTQQEHPPGARVFATGGIGGVHRNWTTRPDISTDLNALANTPVAVVCSGPKSLLDGPATMEALEMLGVPVVGYMTANLPRFIERTDPKLPLRSSFNDLQSIARLCDAHWNELGRRSAVLVCAPVPEAYAVDADESQRAAEQAERDADAQHITGPDRTPFVLDAVNRLTDGRSLSANLALLLSNASIAAQLAQLMNRS